MRRRCLPLILLGVLLISPPSVGATETPQARLTLERRIATIAHALQTANAGICNDRYPQSGMTVRVGAPDAASPVSRRPAVVYLIVPESAAANAGLAEGDEIIAIDAVSTGDLSLPDNPFRTAWLAAERSGVLQLTVRTGQAAERKVTVTSQPGCNAFFDPVLSDKPTAVTYGNRIELHQGLIDIMRSDEELAFIMAHELAHAVLQHSLAGNEAAMRDRRKRFVMEQDADRLGLLLMINAGFDARTAGPGFRYFASRSRGTLQKLIGAYGPYMPTGERVRYLDEHSQKLMSLPRPLKPEDALGMSLP